MASYDTACNIWPALPEVEQQCERQQGQHGQGGAQVLVRRRAQRAQERRDAGVAHAAAAGQAVLYVGRAGVGAVGVVVPGLYVAGLYVVLDRLR